MPHPGVGLGYCHNRPGLQGIGMSFEDGMAYELEAVAALADTPDFAEGVEAFLAKRPPVWPRD